MTTLRLDFETRSTVDLPKANVYVYAAHKTTDVWCAAYAVDNGPVELWTPGQPVPQAILDAVENNHDLAAWNAAFERIIWRDILTPRYGWPAPRLEQWRCTMAAALALSLPGKLDSAAPALGLSEVKDAAGHRLMLQMSKPRKIVDGEPIWWDDPVKKERLFAYCRQDVMVEQEIAKRILPLSAPEQAIYILDAKINDRGVRVDAALCQAAAKVVSQATTHLNTEMRRVTDDEVRAVTNTTELTTYIRKHGLDADSVAKDELVEILVRDDLLWKVRAALELRQEGAKSSTAKINAFLVRRQADGRMRGNLQYHGAGTGRWAGRGAQLQNLPRPTEGVDIHSVVDTILAGDASLVEMFHGAPLTRVADVLRSAVVAEPGHRLLAADFAQIEARVTAWLAGQHETLEAFRRYDAGTGPDIYTVTASGIYGEPITKKDPRRQVGKVASLSLGFGGGALALLKMAKNYRLDLLSARDAVIAAADPEDVERADDAWTQRGKASGVDELRWKTAELVKLAWREANPKVVQLWKRSEEAAIEAVNNPGRTTHAGRIKYLKRGSFLFAQLPVGRVIAYPYPRIEQKELPWENEHGEKAKADGLVFEGPNPVTKKWTVQNFYGGFSVQNCVQAFARDVMAAAMLRVEEAGYPVVLTVHDEVVSEAPNNHGSLAHFEELIRQTPSWVSGCPIASDAWEGPRYRK